MVLRMSLFLCLTALDMSYNWKQRGSQSVIIVLKENCWITATNNCAEFLRCKVLFQRKYAFFSRLTQAFDA